jgi:hypothetical protein
MLLTLEFSLVTTGNARSKPTAKRLAGYPESIATASLGPRTKTCLSNLRSSCAKQLKVRGRRLIECHEMRGNTGPRRMGGCVLSQKNCDFVSISKNFRDMKKKFVSHGAQRTTR